MHFFTKIDENLNDKWFCEHFHQNTEQINKATLFKKNRLTFGEIPPKNPPKYISYTDIRYTATAFFLLQNPPFLSQNPFSEQPIHENPAAIQRFKPIDSHALNAVGPLHPSLNKQYPLSRFSSS